MYIILRLQNENNNLEEQRKKVASERDNLKLNLSEDCKIIADLETRIVRYVYMKYKIT